MARRNILVADDLGATTDEAKRRSQYVQRLAGDLSVLQEFPVSLIYVQKDQGIGNFDVGGRLRKTWKNALSEKYKTVLHNFSRPGDLFLTIGSPVEEILKTIKKDPKLDSVVMGTSGKGGLELMFLGSVAEEVLRSSPRPVFILGPQAQAEDFRLSDSKKIRILVATDLSEKARPAEAYAMAFAKGVKAEVVFFYSLTGTISSLEQSVYMADFSMNVPLDQTIREIVEEAKEKMQKKVTLYKKQGLSCQGLVEEKGSSLVSSILKRSEGFQFVFMGTSTRRGVLKTFLGSTVRSLIVKSKIPVVVIHS